MDYEKKCKDLVKAIKELQEENPSDKRIQNWVNENVPELAESEDERIRKWCISHFRECFRVTKDNVEYKEYLNNKVIPWLEKQKKAKIDDNDLATLENWESIVKDNKDKWQLSDWFIEATSMLINKIKNIDINGNKTMLTACINALRNVGHSHLADWLEEQGKSALETTKEEKVDNANKVEPKFRVGDFIVNDYCMGKVIELTNDAYLLDSGQGIPFSCEHNAHLWTIDDAKDGDVLIADDMIVLFNRKMENNSIVTYFDYNTTDNECDSGCRLYYSNIHPATKEQCDTLMKAMADAGFTFDFDKKELKKIEQNPADRVEPKFKVGDWVMLDRPVLITKVEDMPYNTHQYWTSDGTWFGDSTKAKLWTIQDAKDGDVLADYHEAYDNPLIFILKKFERVNFGLVRPSDYSSHCFLTAGDIQRFKEGTYHHKHNIKPATKEQRDKLEKAMADAGFTFDFDKKELKKIEQNPAWSEEDERMYRGLHNLIYSTSYCDSRKEFSDWLKSLKDRVQPQIKQKWSEDDKKKYIGELQSLMFEWSNRKENMGICIDRHIDKLLSLHPQSHWKPSDEQMKAFEFFIRSWGESGAVIAQDSTYNQMRSLYEDLKNLK